MILNTSYSAGYPPMPPMPMPVVSAVAGGLPPDDPAIVNVVRMPHGFPPPPNQPKVTRWQNLIAQSKERKGSNFAA